MGCGNDSNVNTHIEEGASGGSIIVHVSDGDPISTPVYSWSDNTNDATAMRVVVAPVDDLSALVWDLRSESATVDSIHWPVIHGMTQVGTFEANVNNPKPDLDSNVWYRVTVTKADIGQSGSREFLIKP